MQRKIDDSRSCIRATRSVLTRSSIRRKARTRASTRISILLVKVAFFTVFAFRHHSEEIWRDAQHGGIIGMSARKFADEDIVIGDRQVSATRYTFIIPYLAGSIWYDEQNLWVHGEFERDGSRIQYQLDT